MISNRIAIKTAFGRMLQRWHRQVIGTTPAVREFAQRPFGEAALWAPGRMVDQVEEMLESYRKNDTLQSAQPRPKLPVLLAAMSNDFMPSGPEYGRASGDEIDVVLPADERARLFRLSVIPSDLRVQCAILAPEDSSAHSIAEQLHRFVSTIQNRLFYAAFPFAGMVENWPVQIELPEISAVATPTDQKNLVILVVDLTLRALLPQLRAPAPGEPNDGQGGDNAYDPLAPNYDPHGFPTVVEALVGHSGRTVAEVGILPDNALEFAEGALRVDELHLTKDDT